MIRSVLACLGLEAGGELRQRLGTAIMEIATSLASEENSSVDAVCT